MRRPNSKDYAAAATATATATVAATVVSPEAEEPHARGMSDAIDAHRSGGTKAGALMSLLDEDTMRRRFRRFLGKTNDENLRFWDAVDAFLKEPEKRRATSARAIIQFFVLDTAPKQVNLKAETRARLVQLYKADDRAALSDVHLFDDSIREVFNDLKQSDGFARFLEQEARSGGTTVNLAGPSDSSLS